jgi:PPOX class probable F420-dependent enzyme
VDGAEPTGTNARPRNRREQIRLTPAEQSAFLAEQRVVVLATNGTRGWPHLMPLWYVVRSEQIWGWTYGRSQKVRNLERDPRATLQVEDGERYEELRGVMIEAHTELHRDLETVAALGTELMARYSGVRPNPEMEAAVRTQAAKRVALQFRPERVTSWDHRKLGGVH